MKRTLTFVIGATLFVSQAAMAQDDDRRGRGGGRGQARAATQTQVQRPSATMRQSAGETRQAVRQQTSQPRQVVRTESPRRTTMDTARVQSRTDLDRTTTSSRRDLIRDDRRVAPTSIRSAQTTRTRDFDDDRTRFRRDRDDDVRFRRDSDRDDDNDRWRDRRDFRRPPVTVFRNWDRDRVYTWDNHRWRWYGGTWVIYDASPSVVYTSDTAVVGSSVIADVQEELQEEGYDPGPADGVMGARTRDAIAEYQSDHGLAVTGTITNSLLRSLDLL